MPIQEVKQQKSKNLYSKNIYFQDRSIEGYKAKRSEEILQSTATFEGNIYNVDEVSMDRFDRVIDLANWKYNQSIASGLTPAEAYSSIYKDTTINWKTYDNKFVILTIENICEIQTIALNNLNKIWIKWG